MRLKMDWAHKAGCKNVNLWWLPVQSLDSILHCTHKAIRTFDHAYDQQSSGCRDTNYQAMNGLISAPLIYDEGLGVGG